MFKFSNKLRLVLSLDQELGIAYLFPYLWFHKPRTKAFTSLPSHLKCRVPFQAQSGC